MIKELKVVGFRGFGSEQSIKFSIPDGLNNGSGLNIITGQNNSGKTSIIESIQVFNNTNVSFSEGRRNKNCENLSLVIIDENDQEYSVKTTNLGCLASYPNRYKNRILPLPSRRNMQTHFNYSSADSNFYIKNESGLKDNRPTQLQSFFQIIWEIFKDENKKKKLNDLLKKVLIKDYEWTIDQQVNNNFYVKFLNNGDSHSNDGLGDGMWNIFTICCFLAVSKSNDTIIIDEPELSLHTKLKRRLALLLKQFSKDRQIILSTHDSIFIDYEVLNNGGELIRVTKENNNTVTYQISNEIKKRLYKFSKNISNPHILGRDASEVFFLEDKILLVEGQEDVVIYNKLINDLNKNFDADFFGWGVGGAGNMELFLDLFQELGFKKIFVILDGDQEHLKDKLFEKISKANYRITTIPTDDIRDKKAKPSSNRKIGMTDDKGNLKDEYFQDVEDLINDINSYMNS